ncbi:MAG: PEP-CTERM sorting domain-containing protein [Deltaproteobacteria bacterium]|nr:MAG: PEP-CTERM sorting domain-containing protein [Deltaproteobacteria bacterium]
MDPGLNGVSYHTYADGTEVFSGPRNMQTKTVNGWTGLGVEGGFVPGEVDLKDSEWITIRYRTPVMLDHIMLGFLFPNGQYGDTVNEKAKIRFSYLYGNETVVKFEQLVATGGGTANWSGVGVVSNLSLGAAPYSGVWRIDSPFENPVTSLKFSASQNGGSISSGNSDFSIVEVAPVAPVPEPSTLVLLGGGLVGLASWGRKKFRI